MSTKTPAPAPKPVATPKKVVALHPPVLSEEDASKTRRSANAKWGDSVMASGFVMVPAILLRAQRRLGLSGTQLAVLLHLIDWWMDADRVPWSSKEHLSQRIGISERQLQRQVAQLEIAGLVQRKERISNRGRRPNGYDLTGLVQRLKELAPEFQEASSARRKVEMPGGLARKKTA